MPDFMESIHLSITVVNAPSEELRFFLNCIAPQMVLGGSLTDAPATTHCYTMDLFVGAREAD